MGPLVAFVNERMRLSERNLKMVLDNASDGVLVECDEEVAYANAAYARMLGYPSPTEIVGSAIRDIADPDDLERLTWFGRCRVEGKPAPTRYSFRARGRSGNTVVFDACISVARAEGKTLITTIVREVQQAVQAEGKLELPGLARLSTRELEIVKHLLDGKRSKEIALLLDISEKTICTHRCRAFRKLGLRSDRELFRMAAELGVL